MTARDQDTVGSAPAAVIADRSAGVALASAAGDALGAGYEFGPPMTADTPVGLVGGGPFGWEPGEWTDDTQMALGILSVLSTGGIDTAEIEAAFRAWYASGPADIGAQTRAVLSAPGPMADNAAAYAAQHPNSSAGNGSLMRTGPVALSFPGDPQAIAALASRVSALTHVDPDCTDACILWSVAIDHTIRLAPGSAEPWDWSRPLHAALTQIEPARRERWARRIDEAAAAPPTAFPRNGWVVHAFQAAVAALCSTPVPDGTAPARHLSATLRTAVRAGGDTDTVASIAGAMLGARWGATAVPLAWRRVLHGQAAEPGDDLHAADLDRLARLAANGGRPGAHGWPGCPSMLAHYRVHYPSEPLRTELGGVTFGNAAAVPDAIADGADAVISLCRMGTTDVPDGIEHHVLGLLDTDRADNPNLALLLADAADTLRDLTSAGRSVYVHCVAAENRTPTLAAAWLHRHHGHSAADALALASRALNEPKPFLQSAIAELASIPPSDPGAGP